MKSEQYVRQRIAQMGLVNSFGTKKEISELPKILADNEHLLYITSGFLDGNTWLISCTDKRIIFLDKGMVFGLKQKEIPIEKINSIEHKKGLMFGEITIWDGASKIFIKNISKIGVDTMIKCINGALDAIKSNHMPIRNNNSNDVASQLEKLFNLKVNGVLTEEEFQRQKQRVLNGN